MLYLPEVFLSLFRELSGSKQQAQCEQRVMKAWKIPSQPWPKWRCYQDNRGTKDWVRKIPTLLREGWVGGGKTHFFFLFCLILDIWLATKEKNLKQTRVKKRRGNGFPLLMTLLITVRLSPCGHPAITDTPIIRTADKFRAKINYRHLTEINSRYYGLLLQRTLT